MHCDLFYVGRMELQWRFLPILVGMHVFLGRTQNHGNSMSSKVKAKVIHEASICLVQSLHVLQVFVNINLKSLFVTERFAFLCLGTVVDQNPAYYR